MSDINIWDWRYKIYFSKEIEGTVKTFASQLGKKSKMIYDVLINFYKSFYSFGILIEEIKTKDEEQIKSIIDYAVLNADEIIYTPKILYENYIGEIRSLDIEEKYKEILKTLLDKSLEGKIVYDEYKMVISEVFGNIYENMKEIIFSDGELKTDYDHGRRIGEEDDQIISEFNKIFNSIKRDTALISKYGHLVINDFDKEIKDGSGYAEWWDETLTGKKNKLILYKNGDSLNYYDFKYTIMHELYPGHAHFYNCIKNSNKSKLDHGFIEIIEGWATYAEWNSIECPYIKSVRKNALFLIKNSLHEGFIDYLSQTYNNNIKKGMNERNNISSIINISQYIGFSEAYYWGAVMFEYLFEYSKVLSCKDFLRYGAGVLEEYLYGKK